MRSSPLAIAILAAGLSLGSGAAIAQSSGGAAGGANVGSSLPGGSNARGMLVPGTSSSVPGTMTGQSTLPAPGSNSTVGNTGAAPLQAPGGSGRPCNTALNGARRMDDKTTSSPPIAPPRMAVNPDCPDSDLPGIGRNSTVAPPSTIGGGSGGTSDSPSRLQH